jgi:hypothetical protein
MGANSREARARAIVKTIEDLLAEWDPIGVYEGEHRAPPGEYDRYAGRVYRALASGASEAEIAELLARIEVVEMGGRMSRDAHLAVVARKLHALDVRSR